MAKRKEQMNGAIATNTAGNDELSEGWAVAPLLDLCDVVRGVSYKKGEAEAAPSRGLLPILRANNIGDGRLNFDNIQYVPKERVSDLQHLLSGDVVVAMSSGSKKVVGKAASLHEEWSGGFGAFCGVLRPSMQIDTRYFGYWFQTPAYRHYISEAAAGVNINNVKREHFEALAVPLPPLAEQERIVAKVEALLERVNQARERLDRVPDLLKRFRQSVLAAACSGQLTADWREENSEVESATTMLADLKVRVESGLKRSRDKNLYQKVFEEFSPKGGGDELPKTWVSCRVGHVGQVFNGSTPSRKKPEFWGLGVPWISSGEVQNNTIRETREQITELGFSETSKRLLPVGTVLIAMIGEGKTRGQSAILEIEATINQNMAAVDIRQGGILPDYLWYWFQFQYLQTRQEGGGSGPQALNCQRVRELPLTLPPIEEQQDIVRRVKALFEIANKIEQRISIGTNQTEKITQSILAKAFAGELVETEADLAHREARDYEPASVLLERITAERATSQNGKPKRRTHRKLNNP